MPVIVSMLRGVNVGGHRRIKMDALRALYVSLGLRDPQTYVQSGNVIFQTGERNLSAAADLSALAKRIEDGIERKFGFRCEVIVRTAAEMRSVVARNPFAKRRGIEPKRLLVMFLAGNPTAKAREEIRRMRTDPEEMRIEGREVFLYYPNGMARATTSWTAIEKALGTSGTTRNWNSVTKMLGMAEELGKGNREYGTGNTEGPSHSFTLSGVKGH